MAQKDALIAAGTASVARLTGQYIPPRAPKAGGAFSSAFAPIFGPPIVPEPSESANRTLQSDALFSVVSLECVATPTAGEWLLQACITCASASVSILGLSVSSGAVPLQCASAPIDAVQVDRDIRLSATVSASSAAAFALTLPAHASVLLLYHTMDHNAAAPLAFPLGSVTLTEPTLADARATFDAPLLFSIELALNSVTSDLAKYVSHLKEGSHGRVLGAGTGQAAEITVRAESAHMLAVLLNRITATAPDGTLLLFSAR